VMDKEQYKRVREIGAFAALFPTAIFINDMSADEKLEFLEREVALRGFELAPKGFSKSELLKGGADAIKAAAADAVTRKMTADAVPDLRLTIADFKGGRKKRTGEKSPFDELEALIGLHSVKACIREIATYVKNRGRDNIPCLHMVFRGNPGTGKTTVARILGKIFAEVGAVSKKDVFVEADRNKLVSIYLGGTAEKTTNVVKSAFGGVLFIDEAYSLCAGDGFAHDYGRESVNALVKLMEDHRRDFVCIMAGYTREMDELLDMNPGLRERVQFYVDFPDYDAGELTEIFAAMCRERKYRLSPGALRAASAHFERIAANKDERFANGRVARKAFERVALKQALRGTTDSVLRKDIDAAFADDDLARLCASSPGARRIGFAVPEDATVRKSLA
ncbi:MAG: AAA family ATPase, partial [Clostridiales Family XIII bacterium]|nr:AAA family ATPase [Clostridiales Family XIII bacterium]